jgi:cold shock protein
MLARSAVGYRNHQLTRCQAHRLNLGTSTLLPFQEDAELSAHLASLQPQQEPAPERCQPTKATNMHSGKIRFFDPRRGYGFIVDDTGGPDIFVHVTAAEQAGLTLRDNMRLSFDLVDDRKSGKSKAANLVAI